jgi:hypothetical protein
MPHLFLVFKIYGSAFSSRRVLSSRRLRTANDLAHARLLKQYSSRR